MTEPERRRRGFDGDPMTSGARKTFFTGLLTIMFFMMINFGLLWWKIGDADQQRDRIEREAETAIVAQEREADRRWCALITQIDDNNRQRPPRTPTGQQFAKIIAQLRTELGCPPSAVPAPTPSPTK